MATITQTITLGAGVHVLRITASGATVTLSDVSVETGAATLAAVTGTGALATVNVTATVRGALTANTGAASLATLRVTGSALASLAAIQGTGTLATTRIAVGMRTPITALSGTGALAALGVSAGARTSATATAGAGALAGVAVVIPTIVALAAVEGRYVPGESPAPGSLPLRDSATRRWVPIRHRLTGAAVPIRLS